MRDKLLSPFTLLCTVGFMAWVSYSMARSPLLPLFTKSLGADPAMLGFVAASSTITGIVFKAPSGALSDILGRRKVMMMGMAVFGLVPFLYLLVNSYWQLTAVRFLHGFATAIFGPVAAAMVADFFDKQRGEKIGWYASAVTTGKLLGPLLGGYILLVTDFKHSYLIVGIIGITSLIIAMLGIKENARKENMQKEPQPVRYALRKMRQGFAEVLSDFRISIVSAVDALSYLAVGALETFLPLYGIFVLGLDSGKVGILFAVQAITTLMSRPVMGRLSDTIGRKPMIISGLMVSALSLGAVTQISNFYLLMLVVAVYGLGVAITDSSTTAMIADLSKARNYGAAMGVQGTILDIGHASGPILAGIMVKYYSYNAAFIIAAIILVCAALLFGLSVRDNQSTSIQVKG